MEKPGDGSAPGAAAEIARVSEGGRRVSGTGATSGDGGAGSVLSKRADRAGFAETRARRVGTRPDEIDAAIVSAATGSAERCGAGFLQRGARNALRICRGVSQ